VDHTERSLNTRGSTKCQDPGCGFAKVATNVAMLTMRGSSVSSFADIILFFIQWARPCAKTQAISHTKSLTKRSARRQLGHPHPSSFPSSVNLYFVHLFFDTRTDGVGAERIQSTWRNAMKRRISALYVWYTSFSRQLFASLSMMWWNLIEISPLSCRLLGSTLTAKYQFLRAHVRTKFWLVLGQWQGLCPLYNEFISSTTV
jgi:hypothetical protein